MENQQDIESEEEEEEEEEEDIEEIMIRAVEFMEAYEKQIWEVYETVMKENNL